MNTLDGESVSCHRTSSDAGGDPRCSFTPPNEVIRAKVTEVSPANTHREFAGKYQLSLSVVSQDQIDSRKIALYTQSLFGGFVSSNRSAFRIVRIRSCSSSPNWEWLVIL